MRRALPLALVLSFTCSLAAAQPDRTAALAKAKAKFEADISKAEDALIASLDKALTKAQASGNKAAAEKLAYERDAFNSQRLVPTAVPTTAYLRRRGQAITALEAAYLPAIKEFGKAKKDADAEALETALSDALKSARGYGLGVPNLEAHPVVLIEHKATGKVIETVNKGGTGELVLGAKVGKSKPSQCWLLEREEKGYVIRNVASRQGFHVPYSASGEGDGLVAWPPNDQPSKEVLKGSLYQITDIVRREVVIHPAWNPLVLTATEKKVKGVTTYYITQEKKETPPLASQRWTLTEVK
jgi:hypothetical protein